MRISILLAVASLSCLFACRGIEVAPIKNLPIATLEKLNTSKKDQIRLLLAKLNEKKHDPLTMERAKFWVASVDNLVKYLGDTDQWFDSIEAKIRRSKSYEMNSEESMYLLSTIKGHGEFITSIFKDKGSDNVHITKEIDQVVHSLQSEFLHSLQAKNKVADSAVELFRDEDLIKLTKEKDLESLRIILHSVKAEIYLSIQQILEYIDIRTTSYTCGYSIAKYVITSNYSALRNGEELEIFAGIGSFSGDSKPKYFVSGIEVNQTDGEPFLWYKKKINQAPGLHSIPVTIKFTKPDGTYETVTKYVKYKVLPEQ